MAGKPVLVREDLNVPMKDGRIQDDTRIRAAQPTLDSLRRRRARTIVMSHLGRPDGKRDPKLSLRPIAESMRIRFAEDCIGEPAQRAAAALGEGEVLLLENVRFHPEEEENDPDFARGLASLGEIYVNDAFAASHRAHA